MNAVNIVRRQHGLYFSINCFVGQPVLDLILTGEINIFKTMKTSFDENKTRSNNDDIYLILIKD